MKYVQKSTTEELDYFIPRLFSFHLIGAGDAYESHCTMGDNLQEDNDGMNTRQIFSNNNCV